jgi:tape measure domain-containing protein
MKDMMSGGLSKIAQNINSANKSTKTMSYSLNELKQKLQEVNSIRTGTVLANEFKQATKEANKLKAEIKSIEGGSRGGGGGMLSGMLGRLAPIAAAIGIGAAIIGGLKSSAKQYMNFERNNRTYEVLTGNRGIGQALGGSLNELKQNTILGTAVYPNAQKLLAFGDSVDKVIPHLKMLGDISMGDSERLGRLTYAFGEVESAGKLTGRQLMQFINAGFNPLNEISKKTGKSMEELRKEMRKGEITFKMVDDAFQSATGKGGKFHDMLNQMSTTLTGKLANLHGKIAALEIAIGERLAPAIGFAFDKASKLVTLFKHWFEIPYEQKLSQQIASIRGLQAELTASNTSHQRQIEIFRELEQINPNIVSGIKEQSIEYGKLATNIDNVVGSLKAKIFSETLTKANADVIQQYNEAQLQNPRNVAKALSVVGSMYPDLAQNTTLTPGQKELIAKQRLLATVRAQAASDPRGAHIIKTDPHGITYDYRSSSKENMALVELQRSNYWANDAIETIKKLQPQIDQINKTKQVLESQFNKYAGVKSMNAANIANNGGKTNAGADTGSDVAKGITGGGPRVININGVKFTDKIEIHSMSMKEGEAEMERRLEEMWLRLLNSGANVQ